jgi:antitoxin CcdA
MSHVYDVNAAKRPVNMTLNEDLVRRAREYTTNLSEQVEQLLADYVAGEHKRRIAADQQLDRAIDGWNEFYARYGSFADESSEL